MLLLAGVHLDRVTDFRDIDDVGRQGLPHESALGRQRIARPLVGEPTQHTAEQHKTGRDRRPPQPHQRPNGPARGR